jgi:hypothetical protein
MSDICPRQLPLYIGALAILRPTPSPCGAANRQFSSVSPKISAFAVAKHISSIFSSIEFKDVSACPNVDEETRRSSCVQRIQRHRGIERIQTIAWP